MANSRKNENPKETNPKDLVGRIVKKHFEKFGDFLGKVTSYAPTKGFFHVKYEDGDEEDLFLHELSKFFFDESTLEGEFLERRKRLDDMTLRKRGRGKGRNSQNKKTRVEEKSSGMGNRVAEVTDNAEKKEAKNADNAVGDKGIDGDNAKGDKANAEGEKGIDIDGAKEHAEKNMDVAKCNVEGDKNMDVCGENTGKIMEDGKGKEILEKDVGIGKVNGEMNMVVATESLVNEKRENAVVRLPENDIPDVCNANSGNLQAPGANSGNLQAPGVCEANSGNLQAPGVCEANSGNLPDASVGKEEGNGRQEGNMINMEVDDVFSFRQQGNAISMEVDDVSVSLSHTKEEGGNEKLTVADIKKHALKKTTPSTPRSKKKNSGGGVGGEDSRKLETQSKKKCRGKKKSSEGEIGGDDLTKSETESGRKSGTKDMDIVVCYPKFDINQQTPRLRLPRKVKEKITSLKDEDPNLDKTGKEKAVSTPKGRGKTINSVKAKEKIVNSAKGKDKVPSSAKGKEKVVSAAKAKDKVASVGSPVNHESGTVNGEITAAAPRVSRFRPQVKKIMEGMDDESCSGMDDGVDGNESDESFDSVSDDELDGTGECFVAIEPMVTVPLPAMQPLPKSSTELDILEDSVPHLLSVYSFLRTFSHILFLSPFSLQDFVAALNYKSSSTLLDAVHVALLRAAKRHLEMLSKEGNEQAIKSLRHLDWNYLDAVTWPVYLVDYLLNQGFSSRFGNKFSIELIAKEYYKISAETKLLVLQFLCDEILDSEEIRTVVRMRLNFDQELDADGKTNDLTGLLDTTQCSSKRKRISCAKDDDERKFATTQSAMESVTTVSLSENSVAQTKRTSIKDGETETNDSAQDQKDDFNSDECLLCGMHGDLICCDGCPFAYHSRCVGVTKINLPPGDWLCPECVMDRIDPRDFNQSNSFVGAKMFGVDPYGRAFLGTCGYLLVIDSSADSGSNTRYYKKNDLHEVFKMLEMSGPLLHDIRCEIMGFWDVQDTYKPEDSLHKVDGACVTVSGELSCGSASAHPEEKGDVGTAHPASPCSEIKQDNLQGEILSKDVGMGGAENLNGNSDLSFIVKTEENIDLPLEQREVNPSDMVSYEEVKIESTVSMQDEVDKKIQSLLPEQKPTPVVNKASENIGSSVDCNDRKSSSKPESYVNHYVLGDIAASAAAMLASAVIEDKMVDVKRTVTKKTLVATMQEQQRAFSRLPLQFVWPSHKKKVAETLKERCSWCATCQLTVACKKGCLLSAAYSNAMAGVAKSMKFSSSHRPTKNGEGHLPSVAAYILYIEESLQFLMVGEWENPRYRKFWRKSVEQASTIDEIRESLLQLEKNIRAVALLPSWFKDVDGQQVIPINNVKTNSTIIAPKKVGNRRQKAIVSAAIEARPHHESYWWRGGRVVKSFFHRHTLPSAVVKQAARRGGTRELTGIFYGEGSDIPKESRHYAWQAAVENAKTISQLAFQVRYLDAYIRWDDLAKGESSTKDGKEPDKEVMWFRNVRICQRQAVNNTFKYLMEIDSDKELPIAVEKNGILVGEAEGIRKFLLEETKLPLYILKEFEERLLQSFPIKISKNSCYKLSNLIKKESRKRIGLQHLLNKLDMDRTVNCGFCEKELVAGKAVKCACCNGYCHCECTTTLSLSNGYSSNFTCFRCYEIKISEDKQLVLKEAEKKAAHLIAKKRGKSIGEKPKLLTGKLSGANDKDSASPTVDGEQPQKKKLSIICYQNGLLWDKNFNKKDPLMLMFHAKKLLFPQSENKDSSMNPTCFLCHEIYNPDLMYIGCSRCSEWFHADAFGLNQQNVIQLVGLKCHRCRRRAAPVCPYQREQSSKRQKLPTKRSVKKARDQNAGGSQSLEWQGNVPMENYCDDSLQSFESAVKDDETTMVNMAERMSPDLGSSKFTYVPDTFPVHQNNAFLNSESLYNDVYEESWNVKDSDLICPPESSFLDVTTNNYVSDIPFGHQNQVNEVTQVGQAFTEAGMFYSHGTEGLAGDDNYRFEGEEMPAEPYYGNEPLFSFTELLASGDDEAEASMDQPQNMVEWPGNISTDNILPTHSSQHGQVSSSVYVQDVTYDLRRDAPEASYSGFQTGAVNSSFSDRTSLPDVQSPSEWQFYSAQDQTALRNMQNLSSQETAGRDVQNPSSKQTNSSDKTRCVVCSNSGEATTHNCRHCGQAIHSHCYSMRPQGMLTLIGWTCESCMHG